MFLGLGILAVIIVFIGTTYAYWNFSKTQMNANQNVSKCFDLSFTEQENSNITIQNALPWFLRGGRDYMGTGAVLFNSNNTSGREDLYLGYRIVLSF